MNLNMSFFSPLSTSVLSRRRCHSVKDLQCKSRLGDCQQPNMYLSSLSIVLPIPYLQLPEDQYKQAFQRDIGQHMLHD